MLKEMLQSKKFNSKSQHSSKMTVYKQQIIIENA